MVRQGGLGPRDVEDAATVKAEAVCPKEHFIFPNESLNGYRTPGGA
jgi:hypothetical protein